MLEVENVSAWSKAIFGKCSLGDKRLTNRLVQVAYQAITKLGGWTDSKRTGKAAWSTIWEGCYVENRR